MRALRAFKAIIYPLGGLLQFYLATRHRGTAIVFVMLGAALIALGVLNLYRLVCEGDK